jgi:hypothetical protein
MDDMPVNSYLINQFRIFLKNLLDLNKISSFDRCFHGFHFLVQLQLYLFYLSEDQKGEIGRFWNTHGLYANKRKEKNKDFLRLSDDSVGWCFIIRNDGFSILDRSLQLLGMKSYLRIYWVLFFLLLDLIGSSIGALFLETTVAPEEFRFGVLYLKSSLHYDENREYLLSLAEDCLQNSSFLLKIPEIIERAAHKSLYEASLGNSYFQEDVEVSSQFNLCNVESHKSDRTKNPVNRLSRSMTEEIFLQLSLMVWPANYASVKNYAFMLEYSGATRASESLFYDCYRLTNDYGCYGHYLMLTPIAHVSAEQSELVYVKLLRKFFLALLSIRKSKETFFDTQFQEKNLALNIIRAMPLNAQYLGYSPGRIFELFSVYLVSGFPQLEDSFVTFPVSMNPFTERSFPLTPRISAPSEYISKETQAFLGMSESMTETKDLPKIRLGIVAGKKRTVF